MNSNKLVKSIYLKGDLVLKSPIIIGNGISEETDIDLLLDSNNNPFIPGSSLAGAINYELANKRGIDEKKLDLLFGRKDISKKENINSMIYFYDAYIKKDSPKSISIRDGVKLNDYKTSEDKGKYDFQVLDTGAVFELKIEILLRKKYENLDVFSDEIIGSILKIIKEGELRLGAKSNRGYGKVDLENIEISEFDFSKEEDIDRYIDFEWNNMNSNYERFIKLPKEYKTPYTKIEIPLDIKTTLFIRTYLLSNLEVDSEQITIDKKAVIPGTSWAGVIRHRASKILNEINKKRKMNDKIIEELFGNEFFEKSEEKNKKDISASRIIFDESMDSENTKLVEIMRTKIDRFTGGACDTGLFEGRVAVGGKHSLNIMIKDAKDYEIGLILLVIKDIENGLLAIGGETNVGRGIFKTDKPVSVNKQVVDNNRFDKYILALSKELCL